MPGRLDLLIGATISGLLFSSSPAGAFCRSTTCAKNCPRDDDGCKTTGAKLFWPGVCVGFSLQRDGTVNLPMVDVRPALQAAFYAWSDIDCGGATASLAFAELDDVSCKESDYSAEQPNANVVLFQDTQWAYRGADNNIAKTTVTFDTETGEIFDADIEINHAYNEFTVQDDDIAYDLQSVVTHEVGHFIGLDHTSDGSATMFARYTEGTIDLRTIEPDDIAAVCSAYPPGRGGRCDPTPRNGLGQECSALRDESAGCTLSSSGSQPGSGAGGAPLLALLGLGFFIRAARRHVD